MIGKQILHYQIVEKLGEGGMAAVFRANDTKLHRQVALKFLPSDALERDEDRARFMAEARAVAALDHPNICTVHEINEAEGHLFISMAYVEGRDIKEIVDEEGPMAILDAVKSAVQIAEGLAAAHEKGIVHRDIKSANVMLTPRGQAKIMDFGLAYRSIGDRSDDMASTLGTVSYMSPEQTSGDQVDHRSDIWSFGVMLYEMLTGELPFKGDYESAIFYSVLNESPIPPRDIRTDIPMSLEAIVLKALAKKPADRYQSAEEMLEELIKVRNAVDPTISSAVGKTASELGQGGGAWLRRVSITASVYLGTVWVITRLVNALVAHLQWSPHLVSMVTIGMLSLLPAVLLIMFSAARRGSMHWGKPEWIGVPVNLVVSVVLLLVVFSGKDIGAVTKRVEVTNEEGETIERVIPTTSFRKRFALYVFDDRTGNAEMSWLQYAIPVLVEYAVLQDPFLSARSTFDPSSFNRLKESGFQSWNGVPLTLKRKIAGEGHMDHFVTGFIDETGENGDDKVVTVHVYETHSGKQVAENIYRGTNIFEMADDIAHDVIRSVDVPQWHLDGAQDLPVAEIVTNSEEALRELTLAQKAMFFDSNWNAAIRHLEGATEADSTLTFGHFLQYMVYRVTNQPDLSLAALDAALRHVYKVPERIQFIIKANYYMAKQQPEKVFAVANMMTELYPDDILGYQVKAQVHVMRNEIDEAVEVYDRIIELEPFQYDHLKTAGALCERRGNHERALRYYEQYAEFNPTDPTSFQEIGGAYREMGDFEKAKENYNKALLIEPERVSIMVDAARNEAMMGRFDDALDQLENALRVSHSTEDSFSVFDAMEDYYEIRGEFSASIEAMQARLEVTRKTSPPLQYYLIQLSDFKRYVHAGRIDEGLALLKHMETVLITPPFDKAVAYGYLDIHLANEDADSAEEALAVVEEYIKALGVEMLRAISDHAQARIHEFRGEHDKAAAVYENILKDNPSDYDAYRGMGRCYRMMKDFEKSADYLEKSVKYRPFNGHNNYELALLYYDMGRRKDAMVHLERALTIWQNADPAYRIAARARDKLQEWQTVLE